MALPVNIQDPSTTVNAKVSQTNALHVLPQIAPLPEPGTLNRYSYFNDLLGTTGFAAELDTLFSEMNVDGSVNAVTYYGDVDTTYNFDIYITGIILVYANTANNVTHDTFGGIAMGNGLDLKLIDNNGTFNVFEHATTTALIIAETGGARPFGIDANSWLIKSWNATDDAQIVYIPISEYIPDGFRMGRSTNARIESTVQDDLSGLTYFKTRVLGYRHYS